MAGLLNFGEVLTANARLFPSRIGARDDRRTMTFPQWNERACRLANGLLGLGLRKGDRVAVLAYNCIEWLEIYAAMAKAGLIMVPINFRLAAPEVSYILADSGATALILQDKFLPLVEEVRAGAGIPPARLIQFGGACPAGYGDYEDLIARAADRETGVAVAPNDPWALMFTSGTTGRPKGAIRSHRAAALHALVCSVEFGFGRQDNGLLVMPLCHANSLFFASTLAYVGGACSVYSRASFDPEVALASLADGVTFTSLVPTQYLMMLDVPAASRAGFDMRRVSKLAISSAPARKETKQEVMAYFSNSGLFELYGSTEAGFVTCLRPEEQFSKLGSIGRECVGTHRIRLLDDAGNEVPDGAVGELFSGSDYAFDGYWNLPEKTAEAMRDGFCSVGDMARRDEEGFLYLVDRKSNMIISGGENIYPSEVEAALGSHPAVRDVAVVGLSDLKWGERVHGVVTLKAGMSATEAELVDWCKPLLAGFKRPRTISIVPEDGMPKNATGKILHRQLKARLTAGG